ncbi:MAG: DUF1501 domain-containing protein [Acidobacteria bacterium]|nr:DUF1501 domain-containing protein [Acidobacteriota bacterium]
MKRRQLLQGMGLAGLAGVFERAGMAGPLEPRRPHFAPRAKRLIHIFANGGPSHMDTFDPKPALAKYAGQPLPVHLRTERRTGTALPSPFAFRKYGQSGLEVSEVFGKVAAAHADSLCVIRSMHTEVPNHEPSLMMMNCGAQQQSRPSLGSWVVYGLGSENQNLPGFISLCPGGLPIRGAQNWKSAFLPGAYQGTHIDTRETELDRLVENVQNKLTRREEQSRQLELLAAMNREHRKTREEDEALEARVQSFELAFRMQMEAEDVFDLGKEPAHVREMYGDTLHGRQMLMARRLLEKGVRVVQVWHGAAQPWDTHDDVAKRVGQLGRESDQPIAAFLTDLKQRGMFEDTLIIWGGEFGRTPVVELPAFGSNAGTAGRDHNSYGFSVWLAGGGVKGGTAYGATDEFGFRAEIDRVHVHDLHATLLHLLGFDHEKFTFRYAGRDFRLTDVHGQVVKGVLG